MLAARNRTSVHRAFIATEEGLGNGSVHGRLTVSVPITSTNPS